MIYFETFKTVHEDTQRFSEKAVQVTNQKKQITWKRLKSY